jgi:hypothetical protein
MQKKEEKSQKYRENAQKRWQSNGNAMAEQSQSIKGKENKLKENKESVAPSRPESADEVKKHLEYAYQMNPSKFSPLPSGDIPKIAEKYFANRSGMNWRRNGNAISVWKFDAEDYAMSFAYNGFKSNTKPEERTVKYKKVKDELTKSD